MRGLNRVEVIIILFIGLVVMAVAVPWLLTSRGSARDQQCRDNLRKLHEALSSYTAVNDQRFPFGTIVIENLPPEKRLSWTVNLLPFIDRTRQDTFDRSQSWETAGNKLPMWKANQKQPLHRYALFRCPADEHDSPVAEIQFSSYVGMTGLGPKSPLLTEVTPQAGLWGYNRQTRFAEIVDGREHTVNLLETSRNNGPWTAGGPPTLRPNLTEETPPFGPGKQFDGHHIEGTQVLYADGAVKMMNNATDGTVFEKLCTIAGQSVR